MTSKIDTAIIARIGQLIAEARSSDDPLRLIEIKSEFDKLDQPASIDSLLSITDYFTNSTAPDLKAAIAKRETAAAELQAKRAEISDAIDRMNGELDAAVKTLREATSEHSAAVVGHNRWQALRTGKAEPGYQDYASSAVREWAKSEGVIE